MSNLTDVVGGANMYGGSSYSFTYDRFCNAYSAIYFNVGFLQAPAGVYFSGDFTVIAWIHLLEYRAPFSRIIDFGNGCLSDNVIFNTDTSGSLLKGATLDLTLLTDFSVLSPQIKLNSWYHVAFVFSGSNGYIYVNGDLAGSRTNMKIPRNVLRIYNYIGKNCDSSKPNINATFDDLRIYAGALSAAQILTDYTTSSMNGIYSEYIFVFFSKLK
jgi:hypothetical protein